MTETGTLSSCTCEILEAKQGEFTISIHGRMDAENSAPLIAQLKPQLKKLKFSVLTVDLEQIAYFDDFGALVLLELSALSKATGSAFKIKNAGSQIEKILSIINFDAPDPPPLRKPKRFIRALASLGDLTIKQGFNVRFLISFLGSVILAFHQVLKNPKSFRGNDTVRCMEKTGVNAVPIVGLISFLLGLVMAFVSSIQLKQFGANIYVASLVSIAMVSELGPIMTAIVVAGRSGSAFAAEIGTMKISEEIDALVTMGFNPTLFMAVPRIVASLIVVPLLTLFADIFAIAGGLVVGVFMLDLTAHSYIHQTIETLTLFEVMWGLSKSFVFAAIIAMIGCLRGFETRGGADSVGNAATSAVVSSIFFIILFDSFFAIARSYWN